MARPLARHEPMPVSAARWLLHWGFFSCAPVVFGFLRRVRPALELPPIADRIVLLRTCFIGDSVTFLPTIASIRRAFPSAKLTVVASEAGAEIVSEESLVDEVMICSRRDFSRMSRLQKARFMFQMWRLRPDLFIASTQEEDVWFSLLALFSGAKYRVGFSESEGHFLFNVLVPARKDTSEINRNLDVLRELCLPVMRDLPEVRVSLESASRIESFLLGHGVSSNDLLVAIHPYGARPSRAWFVERYAQVADAIVSLGMKVVLTGDSKDAPRIAEITLLMRGRPLMLSGMLSISELKALLRRCALVVTVDTGTMHLAVALGTPTVALFGPGDFLKWGYHVPHFTAIRKPVSCAPCYRFECDDEHGHKCMDLIAVEDVLDTVKAVLRRRMNAWTEVV